MTERTLSITTGTALIGPPLIGIIALCAGIAAQSGALMVGGAGLVYLWLMFAAGLARA